MSHPQRPELLDSLENSSDFKESNVLRLRQPRSAGEGIFWAVNPQDASPLIASWEDECQSIARVYGIKKFLLIKSDYAALGKCFCILALNDLISPALMKS